MKSNQVIFGDLSNSATQHLLVELNCNVEVWLTKYRWVSKEDVHDGNVFVIGIVVQVALTKQKD